MNKVHDLVIGENKFKLHQSDSTIGIPKEKLHNIFHYHLIVEKLPWEQVHITDR